MGKLILSTCVVFALIAIVCGQIRPNNVIDVPPKCPEGQHLDVNGECVDDWGRRARIDVDTQRIIDVPCKDGQHLDINGNCVESWGNLKVQV